MATASASQQESPMTYKGNAIKSSITKQTLELISL